jgi:hypothetical protein
MRTLPAGALSTGSSNLARRFLTTKLHSAESAELSSDASFLYLVLSREPLAADQDAIGSTGPLVEYGFGEFPAAPEEWSSCSLGHLLARAVQELVPS